MPASSVRTEPPDRGGLREPHLTVEGLVTRFPGPRGPLTVVNDVSFTTGRGEVVGLVGESGCGKSMTVRSILGLVPRPGTITAGSVRLDDLELIGLPPERMREVRGSQIGFVAQNPFDTLNPVVRVRRQFANLMRAHIDIGRRDAVERAGAALRSVGIPDVRRVLDGYPHELSGGMAQRVAIAMSIVLDPQLVVADEPTTALDVTVQRQVLDTLTSKVAQGDRSLLVVTHDLGVVAQYCRSVVVLYAGKVVETGLVQDVFTRPAHPYTDALLRAVPRRGRALVRLHGRLPDFADYPSGCPFAPRCAHAFEPCPQRPPALVGVGAEHAVSCHLNDDRGLR